MITGFQILLHNQRFNRSATFDLDQTTSCLCAT